MGCLYFGVVVVVAVVVREPLMDVESNTLDDVNGDDDDDDDEDKDEKEEEDSEVSFGTLGVDPTLFQCHANVGIRTRLCAIVPHVFFQIA